FALLNVVAAIDRRPQVSGRVLIAACRARQLDFVTLPLFPLVLDYRVSHPPFAGRIGISEALSLSVQSGPMIAAQSEVFVIEFFADIMRVLSVNIEVYAEIHVVNMGYIGSIRVDMPAHRDTRSDHAVTIELPAMHILIPTALKLGRDG